MHFKTALILSVIGTAFTFGVAAGFPAQFGIGLVLPRSEVMTGLDNIRLHEDELCRIVLTGTHEAVSDFASERGNPPLTVSDFQNIGQEPATGWKTSFPPYNNGINGFEQMSCAVVGENGDLPDHLACKLMFVGWQEADRALTRCLSGWSRAPGSGYTGFANGQVATIVKDGGDGTLLAIEQVPAKIDARAP